MHPFRKPCPSTLGFSLVELSIVLVILGLLTGGILSGQSLIRAAELRAVTTEYSRYVAASRAFRDKYFAIPGDMNNATRFWGTDAGGCPGNNTTTTAPGSATCDGDGTGQIAFVTNSAEPYRFWQHLANAGLIEGSFTGVSNSPTWNGRADSIATPNVAKSRLNSALWSVIYIVGGSALVSHASLFDGSFDNVFFFASGTIGTGAILKPEEAWNIDTKLDDGKPSTGTVQSLKTSTQANATTGCSDIAYSTTVSIASSSSYLLSNSSVVCSLIFKAGF